MARIKPRTATSLYISFSQIAASRICKLYLSIFGNYSLKKSFSLDENVPYLFVANHQSQLDPFSVFALLSFRDNVRAAPVRFLTAKTVFFTPLMPLLKSMGCYPTRGNREQIIDESIGYMKQGYNIFMFPEGKRTTEADSDPRRGVSDLVNKASNEVALKMVLVHIEWNRKNFLRRDVQISMTIAPEKLHRKSAATIMKSLYKV